MSAGSPPPAARRGVLRCPCCDNPITGLRLDDPTFTWTGTLAVQCMKKALVAGRHARCATWLVIERTHVPQPAVAGRALQAPTFTITVRTMTPTERRRAA